MPRLFLVRHGETERNSAERFWGRTDVKLGVSGILQAECLRRRLLDESFESVYSSELQRALETTRRIVAPQGLKIETRRELREIDFGNAEGLNALEITEHFPEFASEWKKRTNRRLRYPGGESIADVDARVSIFTRELQQTIRSSSTLIVAHSCVLRVLICRMIGLDLSVFFRLHLDLASLSVLEIDNLGVNLKSLNDVCHLKDVSTHGSQL
jgi:broad specificity phosphatase PhoE